MLKALYPEQYENNLIKAPFFNVPKEDIDEYIRLVNVGYARRVAD